MLKKVGISLLGAMMLSSVALACNNTSIDDEDFLCDFALVDGGGNKQESKQEEQKVLTFDKEVVKKMLMEDGYVVEDSNTNENLNSDAKLSVRKKLVIIDLNTQYVDTTLERLSRYDARLQPVLDAYIADRTISEDFNVEGVTMQVIMKRWKHSDFWRCLGIMNRAIEDPEYAKEIPKGISL